MTCSDLLTSDFDYNLPQELIAQVPSDKRDHSRLMVLNRKTQTIEHKLFKDIVDYLLPGDLMVLNDTKVMPANIIGRKADGTARIEVLLVARVKGQGDKSWTCLVKPGKRLKVGSKIIFSDNLDGKVLEKHESGEQIIEFDGDLQGFMRAHGELPLPPYIDQKLKVKSQKSKLSERYQTVYADKEGAAAAPTAGLHFTPELLDSIKAKGVNVAKLTLHTGLGTFKPVYAEYIKDHKMHSEEYVASSKTISDIRAAKRIIAVGTTSVRTLETIANSPPLSPSLIKRGGNPNVSEGGGEFKGSTDIFIYPGYEFKIVNSMITNFHIPRSTLMMLVSAFAGRDFILKAYNEAIESGYRFFSFGDAMLIV